MDLGLLHFTTLGNEVDHQLIVISASLHCAHSSYPPRLLSSPPPRKTTTITTTTTTATTTTTTTSVLRGMMATQRP